MEEIETEEHNERYSLLWQGVWYGCHTQENVTASVEAGEIENCPVSQIENSSYFQTLWRRHLKKSIPEFAEVSISENGSENGSEVAEH